MENQTLIGNLKGRIEIAKALKLNNPENSCVAASIDQVYCIVENGKGVNNTDVGVESLTPFIGTSIEIMHKIKNTIATNGNGEIRFFPTLLDSYCNILIRNFQETIDFLENRGVDINL